MSTNQAASSRIPLSRIGALIDMIGEAQFPLELARFVHDRVAADHVHLVRVGRLEVDRVLSASHDGSDTAFQLTRQFYSRNLNRFEQALITREAAGPPNIAVLGDHTQKSASPEFRSFGREVGVGSRFLVRKDDRDGAVAFTMLWSINQGDVSHLEPEICRLSHIVAPLVSKHIALCESQTRFIRRLESVSMIEPDLLRLIGKRRPREAQVGARLLGGMSAAEIAAELAISTETVIFHRKRLYDRLNLSTSRELLLWYLSQSATGQYWTLSIQ